MSGHADCCRGHPARRGARARGALPAARARGARARRGRSRVAAERGARHRGRVGLRQVDARRTLLGLQPPTAGELRFEGAPLERAGSASCGAGCGWSSRTLPVAQPRMRVSELVQDPLRMRGMRPQRPRAPRRECARGRGPGAGRALLGRLSPRALGRAAAAGGDRERPRAGALGPRLRRARLRARRLGARAGAAPAALAAPLARPRAAPDHARHRARLGALRPRRRHVPRPHRRAGLGRRRARAATAPVHAGAHRGRSDTRPRPPGRAAMLKGEVPDAAQVPSGCRFHPRCPRARERCSFEDVPLRPSGAAGQTAACWYPGPEE